MRNGPAQLCDGRLGVDARQHLKQVMHGAVVVPVESRGHAARYGPAQHFVELLFLRVARIVVVVEAPGDVLADAVEAQPVVTEAHRQHLRQLLEVFEFAVAARRAQAVAHAQGEPVLAPDLEQRLVVRYLDVVAARLADAGAARRSSRLPPPAMIPSALSSLPFVRGRALLSACERRTSAPPWCS